MTTRIIRPAPALAMAACLAGPALAQEPVRSLGAHEHGHGTLNLAIEGNQVLIELRAPGNDIVGFEHPARSADDKAAVAKARTVLEAPLALITLPVEASCRVDKATAALAGEKESDHAHEGKERHQAGEAHGHHDDHGRHTEFRAEYALTCARPQAIRRIAFPFFTRFPGIRELAVVVLTERGQTSYEVTRDSPAIDLGPAP